MKFLVLSTFIYLPLITIGQKSNFKMSGKLIGQNTEFIVLNYVNGNEENIKDTFKLKNGSFYFQGNVNEPSLAYLEGKTQSRSIEDPNVTTLFIEPSLMSVLLKVDSFKYAKIEGSLTQNEFDSLEKSKNIIYNEMNTLKEDYSYITDSLRKDANNSVLKEEGISVFNSLTSYKNILQKINHKFIESHPYSFLSPYLLKFSFSALGLDSLEVLFNSFSSNVQNSVHGKKVLDFILKNKGAAIGNVAKNFQTKDINNNTISLSQFKGKSYVLLDFWASWCIPCRKGNPHLIELYKKYHEYGFEIIGVSDNDSDVSAWKKAVSQDGIGIWKHVLRGFDENEFKKSRLSENEINSKFVIGVLPTKILIDKNGIIIHRITGEKDDSLDEKLKEIFSK